MRNRDDPGRREALFGLAASIVTGAVSSAVMGGCGSQSSEPVSTPNPSEPPAPTASSGADAEAPAASSGADDPMLGTPAPDWDVPFLGGPGPRLADLRGQVVLLRFWTDTCPFCRATAPALVAIDQAYRERGVTVVGMYHPKPRGTTREPAAVAEVAERYGFSFPVGLDIDWAVLDAYWLSKSGRRYTSVSFVLDQSGIVRFIHPGPEFHPDGPEDHAQCRADYAAVTAAIDSLLT